MNNVPERFLRKIREAKEKRLKELVLISKGTLGDQKLTYIPAEIFELEQLEVLCLRNNHLITIPDAIAQLHNLTSLDLSGNQLTALPDTIGQLIFLERLYLFSNQLNSLPKSILNLKKLTHILAGGANVKSCVNFFLKFKRRSVTLGVVNVLWHQSFQQLVDSHEFCEGAALVSLKA